MVRLTLGGIALVLGVAGIVVLQQSPLSNTDDMTSQAATELQEYEARVEYLIRALQTGNDRDDANVQTAVSFARACRGASTVAR